jgi:mono/diheme cytochrome c family protein
MDRRFDFLSGIALPRGVLPLGDGEALVLAPPHFIHAKDVDGDLTADEKSIVGRSYTDGVRNPEYAPNSPRFGLDNWIYFAHWMERFRYRRGEWSVSPSAFGGQWGLARDDRGVWYFNRNDDPLRAHPAPPHYEARDPRIDRPRFFNQAVARRREVWPARANPGVNRAYQPGILRDDGRLKKFTSAAAPVVYRGAWMPDLAGNVFIAEPAANLVRREIVAEAGTRPGSENAYAKREFLASTDERFRPVDLQNGPDGGLYVVDMHRGLIQHRRRLTDYLREQVVARNLAQPLDKGRIWRIVPAMEVAPREWVAPANAEKLVPLLRHRNGWVRDTAQRMLVLDPSRAQAEAYELDALARSKHAAAVTRVHALWVLEGVGALERDAVTSAIEAQSPVVREHAVRLAEAWVSGPVDAVVLAALERLAATETKPRVAMQLALTLGAVPAADRIARDRAERSLAELLLREGDDAAVLDAVVAGVPGREIDFVRRVSDDDRWREPDATAETAVRRLTESVFFGFDEAAAGDLFLFAAESRPLWLRRAILKASLSALSPKTVVPFRFSSAPTSLAPLLADEDPAIARTAARIGEAIRASAGTQAGTPTQADKAKAARGERLYGSHCAACHRVDGLGTEGSAPRLAGSEWVTGAPEVLIRIVLHGLSGEVDVGGRSFRESSMPEHSALTDTEIAEVATYIRQAWHNRAGPVDTESVAAVRRAETGREAPWTAAELAEMR